MERGHYAVEENGGGRGFAHAVAERLLPLATLAARDRERVPHRPRARALGRRRADRARSARPAGGSTRSGLLPAPFPIEELLDERDLRHVSRLYGIGGLSYGNLSARKDDDRFWMSASGVDKSKLDEPGRDILLVSGYEPDGRAMILSVPPDVEPRRVSVDAIEHWMIYQHHPDVGAILHVHAWMEGIAATDINYPCGTAELAGAVVGPDRGRARPRARRDRPAQPRHHRHRREPERDPRPDRAAAAPPGPDELAEAATPLRALRFRARLPARRRLAAACASRASRCVVHHIVSCI